MENKLKLNWGGPKKKIGTDNKNRKKILQIKCLKDLLRTAFKI